MVCAADCHTGRYSRLDRRTYTLSTFRRFLKSNEHSLIAGALAAPYYYGPGPYGYEPGYGGNAVAYCMRRFKSYDPGSGTYLGYDGYRHSCP
jgi:hypothetical protein